MAVLLSLLHVKRSTGFISRYSKLSKLLLLNDQPNPTPPDYPYLWYMIWQLSFINSQSPRLFLTSSRTLYLIIQSLRLSECKTLLLLLTVASLVSALPELGVTMILILLNDPKSNINSPSLSSGACNRSPHQLREYLHHLRWTDTLCALHWRKTGNARHILKNRCDRWFCIHP